MFHVSNGNKLLIHITLLPCDHGILKHNVLCTSSGSNNRLPYCAQYAWADIEEWFLGPYNKSSLLIMETNKLGEIVIANTSIALFDVS